MGNWERLVWNQRDALMAGFAVTVEVCVIAFLAAIVGGITLCLLRLYVAPLRPIAIVLIEFFRDTPRPWGRVSTYQVLAIVVVIFGVWRFRVRAGAERALCLEACDALSLTDQSALVNFPKTPESPPRAAARPAGSNRNAADH